MKRLIRTAGDFLHGIWTVPYSPPVFCVMLFLITVFCSFFAVVPYITDLYLPMFSLRIPKIAVITALACLCSGWIFGTGWTAVRSGRTHAGQILISSIVGNAFYCSLRLLQFRPMWVVLLAAAALLLGCRVPSGEYLNHPKGGHFRPPKLLKATALRRINILAACMVCSAGLLKLLPLTGPYTERSVLQMRQENSIIVTEQHWADLDEGERYQLLRMILQEECEQADIPVPALSIGEYDPATLAAFLNEDYDIRLNGYILEDVPAYECINTILHEFRHCWQDNIVRMSSSGELSGEEQELSEIFAENFLDYVTSEDRGFEAYHSQPVEEDARAYAARRLSTYYPWPILE